MVVLSVGNILMSNYLVSGVQGLIVTHVTTTFCMNNYSPTVKLSQECSSEDTNITAVHNLKEERQPSTPPERRYCPQLQRNATRGRQGNRTTPSDKGNHRPHPQIKKTIIVHTLRGKEQLSTPSEKEDYDHTDRERIPSSTPCEKEDN